MAKHRFQGQRRRVSGGISRRTMLKRMGYALGAAAVAPSLLNEAWARGRHRPGSAEGPQAIWNYIAPDGYQFAGYPLFYKGSAILNATVKEGDTNTAQLYAIDAQTTAVRWAQQFPAYLQAAAVVSGDIIYVGDVGSHLYALDADTGRVLWAGNYALTTAPPLATSGLATSGLATSGAVIFTSLDGHIYALDARGNQLWSYFTGAAIAPGDASAPVRAGGFVFVRASTSVYALDVVTGAVKWTYNDPQTITGFSGPGISVGNGFIYYVSASGGGSRVVGIDIDSGQNAWASGPIGQNPSSPTYYNGAVYIADESSHFYAWDPTTSQQLLWETSTSEHTQPAAQLFLDGGVAYFSTDTPNSTGFNHLFAIDLVSRGQDIVAFQPATTGAVLFGVETGVCYYWAIGALSLAVGAVNLSGLIHQFFAESELMADSYTSTASGVQGSAPTYRTALRLVDPNKNPRANKSVKVWASGPVTITSAGKTYDLDAASSGKSAWLLTDGLGELSIVSSASAAGGLTTPALYLWANFMGLDEAIVVYPDQDSITKLSNVQPSDLQNAKAYDGSSLLPSSFADFDHLASIIRFAIGGTKTSLAGTQPSRYIAYPASTTNLLYQSTAGPADRGYVPSNSGWSASFGNGSVTFQPGAALGAPPGSWSSFVDFVDNVVNGIRHVFQVTWTSVTQTVATIIDDLNQGYQFVVHSVEEAAQVVVAVLKTVAVDIEKVLEWLSSLFDWTAILAVKDQLKSTATQGIANLEKWARAQAPGSVDKFFSGLASDVGTGITNVRLLFGTSSLASQQQKGNDPQALYGMGGAKSYAMSRWIIEKYTTNVPQATVGGAGPIPQPGTDPILSVIGPLITQLGSTIANSSAFRSIPGDLKDLSNQFSLLASDPSQFVTHSFNDILDLLADIVTGLIQFTGAIVDTLVQALLQLLDAVLSLVTATIDIPVISDLYKTITNGSSLSVLDLCCLIVAIPTSIVQRALADKGAKAAAPRAVSVVRLAYLFCAATYAVLDPVSDFTDSLAVSTKWGYLAFNVLLQGLSFPPDLGTNSDVTYVFYAALGFPIIMAAIDIKKTLSGDDGWKLIAPTVYVFYGIVMLGMTFVLGTTNPAFQGKDYLLFIQNFFTFLPYPFKPLSLADKNGRTALAVIDAVCDVSALGLATAQVAVS